MTKKHSLIQALSRRDVIPEDEQALIEALPTREAIFGDGEDIVRQDVRAHESCLVLEGFAARSQYLNEGTRQLTAIHVPGDFVDLHSFLLKIMDHSVVALGRCRVAFVPHASLRGVTDRSQHLTRLFWLSTVIDGAIQRTWITCLGRRSAEQHFAHLICELYLRLEVVDLARDYRFEFPATQTELGDMLGLSTVHVNRKLKELRKLGLVEWQGSTITITNFEKLAALAEFDPTYLNLWSEPR